MNLKLRKVVKNNIVDYGTPDKERMGFEQKFQMYTILKDYHNIFERQTPTNKYYTKILFHKKEIKRLSSLKNNFKTTRVKNNDNRLYCVNHMNDVYRLGKRENLKFKASFSKRFSNLESFNKLSFINDDKTGKNMDILIKNKNEEEKKVIYDYNHFNFKKINVNKLKSHSLKLAYINFIRRKNSQLDSSSLNQNDNFSSQNICNSLINTNQLNETTKIKDKDENTDIFINDEFNEYKTMRELKNKYKFYHNRKIDIEDINTRYLFMLRNMFKTNPDIKLHNISKESNRKVLKIKNRYYLRKVKK